MYFPNTRTEPSQLRTQLRKTKRSLLTKKGDSARVELMYLVRERSRSL
jgi:hypothetical protein